MIKTGALSLINFYQMFISVMLKNLLGVSGMCRFEETCSAYTKREITEKGVIKGVGLGFVRILKCQPLTS
jgi:uncharacterized protein